MVRTASQVSEIGVRAADTIIVSVVDISDENSELRGRRSSVRRRIKLAGYLCGRRVGRGRIKCETEPSEIRASGGADGDVAS